VSADAVCTDVVSAVSGYAACTDMISAVSGNAGVVVVNQACVGKGWNSESCASQYGERQAENQFGSFHVGGSEVSEWGLNSLWSEFYAVRIY
jgi:hypothetical protein